MIKEITLKLKIYDLNLVCDIISRIDIRTAWQNATKEQRVAYSLLQGVLKKIRKKIIDKEGTTKVFKMKLDYPDASTLYFSLKEGIKYMDTDPFDYYTDNTIQKIINELDQQLI